MTNAVFVGGPNAGKSLPLVALSNKQPKVADCPFTTLVSNLGMCERGAQQVVPGLPVGASIGLYLEVLMHCERCQALVHVMDQSASKPVANFWTIRHKLESCSQGLLEKRAMVVHTKMDLPNSSNCWEDI